MLSEEEIEEDNTFKISVPLITDDELRNIDNNFESLVDEFTKSYVKEKDLVIVQHIMQKQQDKIDQLESTNQKLIEKLEEDFKKNNEFEFMPLQAEKAYNNYYKLGKMDEAQEILEIVKGEKHEC